MTGHAQRVGLFAAAAAAFISAGPVLAQTASQVTPQTFEPQLQKRTSGIIIPEGMGPATPAGAEKLQVRIAGVTVTGGLPALTEEAARLKADLSGRTVTAADLFAAARRLEQAYGAAGYGLVRVVLPAQRLTNGATLRIVIIDGFIESIDTSHLPANIRDRVASVLAPLAGQRGLSNTLIERRLLLAGDMPGTVLRSTLSPGKQSGASVLTIEARYKPATGSLSFDNTMSKQLGTYNAGLGAELNSVFSFGELIYVRASGAPRFDSYNGFFSNHPRNRTLAGGVVVPIGIDGLTLNLEGTVARTLPESSTGLYFMSDFTRYSARLAYPLIRSRNLTVNVTGAFDAQDETLTLLNGGGFTISQDRLRILRAGTNLFWYVTGDSLLTAGFTASFGINGLGARSAAKANLSGTPLSRQGADADFQKLDVTLGYRQPVFEHLTFDLRARAQTSFGQPLLNSEQIGLVSPTGLSSFALGSVQGDSGFVVRGEAQFPFSTAFTLPFGVPEFPGQQGTGLPSGSETNGVVLISSYLFGAYGGVKRYDPTVLEAAYLRGAAYGVGVRFGGAAQSSFNNMNLSLEYGRVERFGKGPNGNRFTLSAAVQF
ncbi:MULTISPECIES: ShlB/FhaC/HecB family hemolysin secretion/activation protein [unclassified Beijerinckia]|uniref:ShlB/FhaC/HecB family hemolysin secretion/activation protein n=1 Tax=unclassified Beijerinckia TaxID=2638183 RepID=UPI001FCE01BF|nr:MULTISPECIES: ShlB/FhaC/HecB family hemolysin secretion/activation protein [unclassified Beijerinckia]